MKKNSLKTRFVVAMSQDSGIDDGSSTDMDDLEPVEVTEEQMQTLLELEQCLQDNPADYNAHVRHVSLLRACRLREKLREARAAFQRAYPLTENMWLEWVEDESEALETMEDVARLETLLQKSHEDYLSVSLWKEHAEVSIARFEQRKAKGEAEVAAAGAVREVFDEALADCGLHVVEGATLWNMCLDFELRTLQEDARDHARVEGLFTRFFACAFPAETLLGARARYVAWRRGDVEGDADEGIDAIDAIDANEDAAKDPEGERVEEVPHALEKSIERAIRAYELRRGHEEAIVKARELDPQGMTLLSGFASYVEMEVSSGLGGEDRVRTVFERAIVEFPTSDYLWKAYIDWMDANGDVWSSSDSSDRVQWRSIKSVRSLVARALRNCPWSGDVWAWHFESWDPAEDGELDGEFQRCRQFLEGNAAEFQKAVVSYVRCSTSSLGTASSGKARAKHDEALLRECIGMLKDQSVVDPDHRCAWLLSSMLAEGRSEGSGTSDQKQGLKEGMAIWEGLLAEGRLDSQYSGTWMSYFDYLVRFGGDAVAKRAVFERAMTAHMAVADRAYVARAWVSFEEREGTHDDLCKARRKALGTLRSTEATRRGIALELEQVSASLDEVDQRKRRQQNDPNFLAREHVKQRRPKGKQRLGSKGSKREDTGNNRKKRKEQEDATGAGAPAKKRQAGEATSPGGGNENETIDGREHEPSKPATSHPRDAPTSDDRVVVFIKYIEATVTEEELAAELAPCGTDLDISLGRDPKTGRSKGFAHVKCGKDTSDKLCALNGKEYRGKRLLIAPSDPLKAANRRTKADPQKHPTKRPLNPPKQNQRVKLGGAPATMLVPRAAVKATAGAPKSNDEFRKMFMKS